MSGGSYTHTVSHTSHFKLMVKPPAGRSAHTKKHNKILKFSLQCVHISTCLGLVIINKIIEQQKHEKGAGPATPSGSYTGKNEVHSPDTVSSPWNICAVA